jgi:hypothetical protein
MELINKIEDYNCWECYGDKCRNGWEKGNWHWNIQDGENYDDAAERPFFIEDCTLFVSGCRSCGFGYDGHPTCELCNHGIDIGDNGNGCEFTLEEDFYYNDSNKKIYCTNCYDNL